MQNQLSYPPRLKALLAEIESTEQISSQLLIRILKSYDLKADDFAEFTDFGHDPRHSYGRTKLHTGKNFVMYLMSWAHNDFTAIHNHGLTDWGAVVFLEDVDHRLYTLEDNHLLLAARSSIPMGTMVPVKGDLIHSTGNNAEKPSMSLHIYGSHLPLGVPNNPSRVYEPEKKRVRITSGAAFLNGTENLSEPEPGITTDEATLLDYMNMVLPYYEKNRESDMVSYIKSVIRDPAIYFAHLAGLPKS